jgi:hypothetical protein
MKYQVASLQLYLGFLVPSNKLGNNPCLNVEANINIISLASLNNPV